VKFEVARCWGQCPTQAEGRLADGRPFFFHARHGEWTVSVGPQGAPSDGDWIGLVVYDIASGEDPTGGWLGRQQVDAILDDVLGGPI
jgi:hypothetical protein